MPYQFIFTEWFDRNLKHLRKHNPFLRQDLESFLTSFDAEAHPLIPATSGARKARMKAKGSGKRGGYRVIYYFMFGDEVWLITIYDKVSQEDLSPAEATRVRQLIAQVRSSRS